MCKSIEIYGTGFSRFKVHMKQINVYKKKIVIHFSWQEYVRLVHKKGLFVGFVSPQKSTFFQFDRTMGI